MLTPKFGKESDLLVQRGEESVRKKEGFFTWLSGRKYGTVWYHPESSKLWNLTTLSFVNFQEKIDWHILESLRV
jgi:hypothetical protein